MKPCKEHGLEVDCACREENIRKVVKSDCIMYGSMTPLGLEILTDLVDNGLVPDILRVWRLPLEGAVYMLSVKKESTDE